ncbi:hypothetical protein [Streptomyces sp. NRRL S-1448]|uniref:hypothetical protein n=1 Tax=Streptomyces sp. NRRL S-1448 TaxID=1463883 RepID=UPI00131BF6C7|nr:hypothetical protein [Streptomyces sp. NRRL S-1448]
MLWWTRVTSAEACASRMSSMWWIVRSSTRSRTYSRTRSPRSAPRSSQRPPAHCRVMARSACSAWFTGNSAETSRSRSSVGAVSRWATSVTTSVAARWGSLTVQWISTSALKNVVPPAAGSSSWSVVTNVPSAISQMVCGRASARLSWCWMPRTVATL